MAAAMIPWDKISNSAGGVISGIAGLFGAGDDDANAQKAAYQQALAQWTGLNVPTVEEQQIELQKLKSAGQLTPEMESAISQDPSAMQGVSVDPRLKQSQMAALAQLQDTAKGGLNMSDKAAMQNILNQSGQAAHGRDAAIMQNMQARGMGGAGNELAQRLMSSQNAATNAQSQGMGVAAQAQNRALEAMMNSGNMASQMNNQDFQQQSAKAQAEDAINRFNTANRQNVQNQNVNKANYGQEFNLRNDQRISDENAALANQQETHNKGLYQQQYNDQLSKVRGETGQEDTNANYYGNQAAATRNMWNNIGGAAGQAISTAATPAPNSGGGSSSGEPDYSASDMGESPKIDMPEEPMELYSPPPPVAEWKGGIVPGDEVVPGDHPANDTVPVMASAGEIVIPKTHSQNSYSAKNFIDLVMKNKKGTNAKPIQ